jgi:hypothetical protein
LQYISTKLENTSPFLSKAFKAMSSLLEMNENSREGWITANMAGNSATHDLFCISATDGVILANYGLTRVGQLFGQCPLTGQVAQMEDTDYPERLSMDYAHIVTKCKNLRHNLRRRAHPRTGAMDSFLHTLAGSKLLGVFRSMRRDQIDVSLPGPPSFFTRRKDGILVPALNVFMTGYKNLFKIK